MQWPLLIAAKLINYISLITQIPLALFPPPLRATLSFDLLMRQSKWQKLAEDQKSCKKKNIQTSFSPSHFQEITADLGAWPLHTWRQKTPPRNQEGGNQDPVEGR